MFVWFGSLTNLIKVVINFVINAVRMIMVILTQIPLAMSFVGASVSYLPAFLLTFVMLYLAVIVIFNLINKGS